jgi:hypothetical protein
MSETTTEEQARWQFRAFHETPEHHAKRMLDADPDALPSPPPDPISIARQQLAFAIREEGYVIDFGSVREESRQSVIVNEAMDDFRLAHDDEEPSGHLVVWSAAGRERVGTDADDPVIDCTVVHAGREVHASVPEPHASAGGSVRLRHNLGGEVTVTAFKPDGEGIGYLFATTLDRDSVHVEFFGGTAKFVVTRDQ